MRMHSLFLFAVGEVPDQLGRRPARFGEVPDQLSFQPARLGEVPDQLG